MTTQTPANRRAITIAAPDPNWRSYSACRDVDPELFFPHREDGPWAEQVADAKSVCSWCPVRQQCLDWALETRQDTGVWGGLSESERRSMHRRIRRYDTRMPGVPEQIIQHRLAEFEAAMAAGDGVGSVARALGTNVTTVNTVLALLDERKQLAAASEEVA
ncbi:WhiB family transcriptional regulator [Streptomyces microflavus]|uniref:WhiB family transcriptional regulator n=1 Tax=Streptomyces microflavus TaxID=1919 RepID=UPI003675D3B2